MRRSATSRHRTLPKCTARRGRWALLFDYDCGSVRSRSRCAPGAAGTDTLSQRSANRALSWKHLQPSICQQCGPSATEANQLDQKLATHRRLMLQVCAFARAVNAIHTSMCDVRMRSHCASGDPTGEPPGTASEPPANRQRTAREL